MITLNLARGDNYESIPLRLPATPAEACLLYTSEIERIMFFLTKSFVNSKLKSPLT